MMKDNFDRLDLGLALGNSNPCLQIKLKSNKGAGVNAGTRDDMVFAASDPLSELVWSPHKGLCLKCADSSLADKKPLLLWNVGPSNLPQSHPQNIICGECNDKKSTVEDNKIVAKMTFHVNQELLKETDLHMAPQPETCPDNGSNNRNRMECTHKEEMNTSGDVYEVNTIRNSGHRSDNGENNLQNNWIQNIIRSPDHTAGHEDKRTLNFLPLGRSDTNFGFAVSKPLSHKLEGRTSTSCSGRIEDIGFEGVITSVGMVMAPEGHFVNAYKAPVSPLRNSLSETEVAQATQENGNRMNNHSFVGHALEFTAENDLSEPVQAEAIGQSKERPKKEKTLSIKASPPNSRMEFCRRKGKEKAFSEDGGERVSNQEEESHESVESSNSAGLCTSRKRCNPAESMAGRKKVKKDNEDTLASRSTIRHDSSFMNWILNMVKGYSRVDQNEETSLALTIAPDPRRESNQLEMPASNRKFDTGGRNMGFRSMFQSLYCTGIRNSELGASKSDELVLSNNAAVSIPQVSCPNKKVESSQNYFMSKENVDAPVSGDVACLPHQFPFRPVNATPVQAVHNVDSAGNIASSHSPKDGADLSDSSCKQRNSEPDNCSPDLLSEGKETYVKSLRNYELSSLWITRLTTKDSSSPLQLDYGNQCEHGRAMCTGSTRFDDIQIASNITCGQKTLDTRDTSNEEAVNVLCEDLKNSADNVEESAFHKEVSGPNCSKMDAVLPYSEFKSSDAMASVFARRLDALKHISPSGDDNTQLNEGNEKYSLEKMAGPPLDAANRILSCSDVGSVIENVQIPRKRVSSSNDVKLCIASDFVACTPKGSQILPICSPISNQMADVPNGLFDAIRKLRLSRVEILKWMNCNVSLSPLDGFFLRLRLGKLEGLGGTGYHVSRVTGYDNSPKDSKNQISVNVGGIQCLVGVQYISNHDFLEDELVAWWCSSLKNGVKLPSKEDLESKLEKRMQMGL